MTIDVLADAGAVALAAAAIIAAEARAAVRDARGFIFAVSGGRIPGQMFSALAHEDVPWQGAPRSSRRTHCAAGHADRNLTGLRESLLAHVPLRWEQIHAMPVEAETLTRPRRAMP